MKAVNVIQKQVFEVQVASQAQGRAVQASLQALYLQQLLPAMENLFNQWAAPHEVITIPRLEIDLGHLPMPESAEAWVHAVLQKLEWYWQHQQPLQAATAVKAKDTEAQNLQLHLAEALLYFLHHGLLPPSAPAEQATNLFELVFEHFEATSVYLQQARHRWPQLQVMAGRLAANLPGNKFGQAMRLFLPTTIKASDAEWLQQQWLVLAGNSKPSAALFWQHLLHLMNRAKQPVTNEQLARWWQITQPLLVAGHGKQMEAASSLPNHITYAKHPMKELVPPLPQLDTQQETGQDLIALPAEASVQIRVTLAGLCLVAPFLPSLFKQLNWLNSHHDFVNDDVQQQAIKQMYYVATGKQLFMPDTSSGHQPWVTEDELAMPRLLCGLPWHIPVQMTAPLQTSHTVEADSLLKSMISHWAALKNTGLDGFRGSFLCRNGLLTRMEQGWILRIEPMGIDVLLDTVPWGFRNIKLPWMAESLTVEWY